MGNATTHRIITKGIGCVGACDGLITSYFSLYCTDMLPEVGHGGSVPLPPGAIKEFYQVVDEPYLIPRDREWELLDKGKVVTIDLKIGEKVIEKIYKVPEKRATMAVNVLNTQNTTRERMKVSVSKLLASPTEGTVRIFNLRKTK